MRSPVTDESGWGIPAPSAVVGFAGRPGERGCASARGGSSETQAFQVVNARCSHAVRADDETIEEVSTSFITHKVVAADTGGTGVVCKSTRPWEDGEALYVRGVSGGGHPCRQALLDGYHRCDSGYVLWHKATRLACLI